MLFEFIPLNQYETIAFQSAHDRFGLRFIDLKLVHHLVDLLGIHPHRESEIRAQNMIGEVVILCCNQRRIFSV